MKKCRSILAVLLLLSLGLSAAACGGSEKKENPATEPEMTTSKYGAFTYQDILFFEYKPLLSDASEEGHTLKYLNLASDIEKGSNVYSGEGNDIFKNGLAVSLIDEEATAENGGVPVFIVAEPLAVDNDDDPLGFHARHRLVRYDMATGKTKILIEDTDAISRLAIYRDRIYYIQFLVGDIVEGGEGEAHFSANYTVTSIPREGGEPERVYASKRDSLAFVGSDQGKLYLNLMDTKKIVHCDPNGENAEKVFSYGKHEANLLLSDGHLYYEMEEGDRSEGETSKLCRLPINDLQTKEEKDGETVIENIYRIEDVKGSKIYYYSAADSYGSASESYGFSVLHEFDAESGKDTVVYDYSDRKEYIWHYYAITDHYLVLNIYPNEDVSLPADSDFKRGHVIIHRETGEYRLWKDFDDREKAAEEEEKELP